ncbi:lysine--tRNA ligase [Nocardioides marinquilinus]|uniref:Lysine--tRNA ligase n=1 Tax=Nocardioides marinquilinus TaxID=1210400 RepID=A0ABP9P9T3_9ACTN
MARTRGSKDDGEPTDWVTRAADAAIRQAGEGAALITCASGASPSGPVHLGNLREFLTVHFVAEEVRRRGLPVRHLHSWDDYDRFRKVPAGVDPSWSEHIGRPLSVVPDPGGCHESWAEHYKEPLVTSLREMGVEMEEVSQTSMYRSGRYREQVLHAVRHREELEAVLARFRTKAPATSADDEDAAGGDGFDLGRFPYKPYCRQCGRDTVTVTAYDDETTDLTYTCASCDFTGTTNLATQDEGKLVWKIDWPMRWAFERVHFEPGGDDHATPGSSYTVGTEVAPFFGWRAPSFVAYSFVGVAGMTKMSSSRGGVPTAADALRILEPPMLRWLYVRRQPRQNFTIDLGAEVVRLYDEWDALGRKAATKRDVATLAWERSVSTAAAGTLPRAAVTVPFRLLSSVADVTAGAPELIARAVTGSGFELSSLEDLEPRLARALAWVADQPEKERTTVRTEPDTARLAALSEDEEGWLAALLDRMPDELDQDGITTLVYGVPKLGRGLDLDDPPTDEVKADQKAFFRLLYGLLVDAERGPRLPTLFLALGAERVRYLLGGADPGN